MAGMTQPSIDPQIQALTDAFRRDYRAVQAEIAKAIVGHEEIVDGVLTCLFTGGHALLEGVPGLGKTALIRALSMALNLKFNRIQFTPDLMPADVIGTNVIMEDATGRKGFEFMTGPIFSQIVLADEINRATPKTQSALLEAMQEKQVTAGGQIRPLEQPFFVMATQNPLEQEGTYPLPEAQLDRFFYKLLVQYSRRDPKKQETWFLIKGHDEFARVGIDARMIEQETPSRHPKASPAAAESAARKEPQAPATAGTENEPPAHGAVRGLLPEKQEPQLCSLAEERPKGTSGSPKSSSTAIACWRRSRRARCACSPATDMTGRSGFRRWHEPSDNCHCRRRCWMASWSVCARTGS